MSWSLWIGTLTTTSAALIAAALAALLAVLNTATSPRSKILSIPSVYFINILTRESLSLFPLKRTNGQASITRDDVSSQLQFVSSINVLSKHVHLVSAILHKTVRQCASKGGHRQHVDQRRLRRAWLFILVSRPYYQEYKRRAPVSNQQCFIVFSPRSVADPPNIDYSLSLFRPYSCVALTRVLKCDLKQVLHLN